MTIVLLVMVETDLLKSARDTHCIFRFSIILLDTNTH